MMLRPNESLSEDGMKRMLSIPKDGAEQRVYEEAEARGTLFPAYGHIWQVLRIEPSATETLVTFVRVY